MTTENKKRLERKFNTEQFGSIIVSVKVHPKEMLEDLDEGERLQVGTRSLLIEIPDTQEYKNIHNKEPFKSSGAKVQIGGPIDSGMINASEREILFAISRKEEVKMAGAVVDEYKSMLKSMNIKEIEENTYTASELTKTIETKNHGKLLLTAKYNKKDEMNLVIELEQSKKAVVGHKITLGINKGVTFKSAIDGITKEFAEKAAKELKAKQDILDSRIGEVKTKVIDLLDNFIESAGNGEDLTAMLKKHLAELEAEKSNKPFNIH